MQRQYNTNKPQTEGQILFYKPYPVQPKRRRFSWLTVTLAAILAALIIFSAVVIARSEGREYDCWALCQPGDRVNLRMEPRKDSRAVGFLECGDEFLTDGISKNGWIHVLNAGDCDCWIYCGYVVTDEPEAIYENYVCVARERVACRRWVDGPQISGRSGWLKNGSDVQVFYIAGDWAVTSRGYIRAEWLEVDPV